MYQKTLGRFKIVHFAVKPHGFLPFVYTIDHTRLPSKHKPSNLHAVAPELDAIVSARTSRAQFCEYDLVVVRIQDIPRRFLHEMLLGQVAALAQCCALLLDVQRLEGD